MKKELIVLLDYWEKEKGIAKEFLLNSLEQGLLSVYRKKAGLADDVKIKIDPETGNIGFYSKNDEPVEPPSFPWERIAAQTAKQVLIQKIREAEKTVIYQEYKSLEGQVISGRVERFENNHIILSFGKIEGLLPQHHRLTSDHLRAGSFVKAYLLEVRKPNRGNYPLIVSRTHPEFVRALLKNEIPELEDGIIEIKALARFAGDITKIAVHSKNPDIDPVGTCIGDKAIRIRHIIKELGGEKIEIMLWSEDIATFIQNSLSPAKAEKVVLEKGKKEAIVYTNDDQIYLAIGKRGQNVRLASNLTEWNIRIHRLSELEKKPAVCVLEEINNEMGMKLAALGYDSIAALSDANAEKIADKLKIDKQLAETLIDSARKHLDKIVEAQK